MLGTLHLKYVVEGFVELNMVSSFSKAGGGWGYAVAYIGNHAFKHELWCH